MNNQPVQVDPTPIYEQRMVVLMEIAPQTNKYRQVLLNKTQVINVSGFLGTLIPLPPNCPPDYIQQMNIELDDKVLYDLPTEIKTITR
jgi:spore coat protein CotF